MPRLPAPELKVEGKLEVDPCEFKLLVLRLNDDLDAHSSFSKQACYGYSPLLNADLAAHLFTRSVARNLQKSDQSD